MTPLIKLTAADCEGIAAATGKMIFQTLVGRGISPEASAQIVENLEEELRGLLEIELLGDAHD